MVFVDVFPYVIPSCEHCSTQFTAEAFPPIRRHIMSGDMAVHITLLCCSAEITPWDWANDRLDVYSQVFSQISPRGVLLLALYFLVLPVAMEETIVATLNVPERGHLFLLESLGCLFEFAAEVFSAVSGTLRQSRG